MTVETIPKGCPVCFSDVKGNDKYLFFCRSCNLLFRRADCNKNLRTVEKKQSGIKPQGPNPGKNQKADLDKITSLFR